MIVYTDNIISDKEPCVGARITLPDMTNAEKRDIELKPFINKRDITFYINYNNKDYKIYIPKGYTWDGASIPFGFRWLLGGKGNPRFLIASCIHDKMCECKWLVNYNRQLSSIIFRDLLLACGCNKTKANIMYVAVDQFQKLIKEWGK